MREWFLTTLLDVQLKRNFTTSILVLLALLLSAVTVSEAAALSKRSDTDRDGMPTNWEKRYHLNPNVKDGRRDLDHDDLSNKQEFKAKTNPRKADTDNDGMPDGWEVQNKLNPKRKDATKDPDHDGVTNIEEYEDGSNPKSSKDGGVGPDYDSGYSDGCDVGYDDGIAEVETGEDFYDPETLEGSVSYQEGYSDGYDECYFDALGDDDPSADGVDDGTGDSSDEDF